MVDLDAYREQSLKTWGQMASGWEDRPWLMEVTGRVSAWLVEKLDPSRARRSSRSLPVRVTWASWSRGAWERTDA